MKRRFVTLDVFTDTPLAGNPLAVVLDSEGLETPRMQAIAREFNLSETVFVRPPVEPRHRAALRIFTPGAELPFAGHPTIGTAVLLALMDAKGEAGARAFGLEVKLGTVPCAVDVAGISGGRARFRAPKLPGFLGDGPTPENAATALGLRAGDVGFARHLPSRHSAGVQFEYVPLASLDAMARADLHADAFGEIFGASDHPAVYVYTNETSDPAHHYRARMFAPGMGIAEDPATGSAAVAFAGALMQFEQLGDGTHDFIIEQGYEMGRPSRIALQLTVETGALTAVEIGGDAVIVSEGHIDA